MCSGCPTGSDIRMLNMVADRGQLWLPDGNIALYLRTMADAGASAYCHGYEMSTNKEPPFFLGWSRIDTSQRSKD